eukprot:1090849-Pleurochrysis_carterae.AAC.1
MISVSTSVLMCTYPWYLPRVDSENATLITVRSSPGSRRQSACAASGSSAEICDGSVRWRKFSDVCTSVTCSTESYGFMMEMGGV